MKIKFRWPWSRRTLAVWQPKNSTSGPIPSVVGCTFDCQEGPSVEFDGNRMVLHGPIVLDKPGVSKIELLPAPGGPTLAECREKFDNADKFGVPPVGEQ